MVIVVEGLDVQKGMEDAQVEKENKGGVH